MKEIKQVHYINADIEEIYASLTNPFTIELWTGYPAIMSTEPESEFSLFDGNIIGKNIEFEENKMIRQQWYYEGVTEESTVTILLTKEKNFTKIELLHENVPDEIFEETKEGWKNIYWKSLKNFFK